MLEPYDLSQLQNLVQVLADVDDVEKPKAIMNFFEAVFGGLDQDEKRFFGGLHAKTAGGQCVQIDECFGTGTRKVSLQASSWICSNM